VFQHRLGVLVPARRRRPVIVVVEVHGRRVVADVLVGRSIVVYDGGLLLLVCRDICIVQLEVYERVDR
jgi:hypothetical protein